ncbi:MAG TPA: DNA polymerase I [Roseiflexaceae bacterium]|nr:DNA polymerase I [Roseiflexaceae bacterium]
MTDNRPLLMLIDGHALAFRAFHALRESGLRASTGEPTYAVYGCISIMLSAIEEYHPTYMAVSFDIGRTFRDDMYAEYKAGRAETPEEFHPQLERIKQLVTSLNIPIYTAEGFEADDVIGTLGCQATKQGVNTLILTGDTDTLQLVDDHVKVLLANPYGRKTTTSVYDMDAVLERYKGLKPSQLADLRGLKGDVSDNIPGVKGIGEAGAISLLNEFGTVENLYEHLDQVPKRYQKHLEPQKEQALFSKHLATIVTDAPVTLDLQAATLHDYDRTAVISLFHELEFGASLIKRLPLSGSGMETVDLPETVAPADKAESSDASVDVLDLPTVAAPTSDGPSAPQQLAMFEVPAAETQQIEAGKAFGDYRAVQTEDDLSELLTELTAAPAFAFDTELNGLRPLQDELVGISISTRPGKSWYVPFGHTQGEQLPRATILNAVRPFFEDANLPKFGHNAKFDVEALNHAGVEVNGVTFDTMLAAALLDKRKGLKDLAFYELKLPEPMTAIEELIGKGKTQITFGEVPVETATNYAAADADMTFRLVEPLQTHLAEVPKVEQIFTRLEMPLMPVLARMEENGIMVDVGVLHALSEQLGARLHELETEIHALNQGPINIGSGDQLAQMLFTKLGLDPSGVDKTKTGKYSLTAMSMEALRDRHHDDPNYAVIDLVLQHRQLTKLKSTYLDALPEMVNPETGRIHTSYSQLGAATGRLSSNDPNLQNIPVRTEEGRAIRRAFIAAPGHVFVAADYSQIELRVLAHVTQDPNLVQTFQEGRDIHASTAAQLFGVPIDQVSKNQRRVAKTTIFGIIYGISSFGLAPRIEATRSEAQALIDALFARFPGIRTYIDDTLKIGKQEGYVQSLFGRRRYFPELRTGGPRRQAAEREAINAPIQATAADIMKIAMINVDEALRSRKLKSKLLLQVHDELILEVPEDEVGAATALVCEQMEGAFEMRVPLQVDVEVGPNWLEMEDAAR